jgi:hypothetical protein
VNLKYYLQNLLLLLLQKKNYHFLLCLLLHLPQLLRKLEQILILLHLDFLAVDLLAGYYPFHLFQLDHFHPHLRLILLELLHVHKVMEYNLFLLLLHLLM